MTYTVHLHMPDGSLYAVLYNLPAETTWLVAEQRVAAGRRVVVEPERE